MWLRDSGCIWIISSILNIIQQLMLASFLVKTQTNNKKKPHSTQPVRGMRFLEDTDSKTQHWLTIQGALDVQLAYFMLL